MVVRLDRADEIIPVRGIIHDRAELIAAFGEELVEDAAPFHSPLIGDQLEPALRIEPDHAQAADKDQHHEEKKEQDFCLNLHAIGF